ncbi:unnamed protein product [Amaranthus hypochondriacus]
MGVNLKVAPIILATLIIFSGMVEAKKPLDPYKVLGVDRDASQRDIKKAFHKLSLQYHPDKNKSKGAQSKFEEINNAYEILSDEQKRKNYDLYGDERGGPSFDGGSAGDYGGYTQFTSGGSGQWQNMGGGGRSFSFSFGGPGGGNHFNSRLNDMFANFFSGEMGGGSGFGGFGSSSGSKFGGSAGSQSGFKRTPSGFGGFGSSSGSKFGDSAGSQSGFRRPPKIVHAISSQMFEKEINGKGITWLLLSYLPSTMSVQQYESMLEEIGNSLKGALKVGKINCDNESTFCKKHGIHPRKAPRLYVYSYITSESGSFVEYNDVWDAKSLKSFCQEHLPRFSRRISLDNFQPSFGTGEKLPRVMLLSTKKDTPVIWRALSGLYRKRFIFYDTQVYDVSDPEVRKLGVNALPAVVGWLSNGEKQILKAGISVKDLESAVQELVTLLESFEKKNKIVINPVKKSQSESSTNQVPLLTASNFRDLCGEETPVCLIGGFKSSKARNKLESILSMVSQKSLSRRRNLSSESKDSIIYVMIDATKQQSFLNAFDKSGFRSANSFLVAYKPRKGKYAAYTGDLNAEEAEKFISSVLSGDVQFTKTRDKPKFV